MADDCGPTVVPSPKLNVYELMATASLDAEASAVTTSGAAPEAGVAVRAATGAPTNTVPEVVAVPPAESETLTVAE